ncbi:EamA-like transporter family protein [Mesocricetibacter intestinalis]|uniref:EamA-like transporter family protein n=1 Tax=Mesocricetibacter intestinalis TaxID=1521930 RepID=A0A4R6VET0_9PAST|nr:DMT family transporter [Mesocricetibacter intestinalis]TDQ59121.1 EamA-like transporter family protein [Mesocricetibacter intestinalis]
MKIPTLLSIMPLIASPEFGRNGQALWGFISGILSGLFLALSMVFVRKAHDVERVHIFPLMLLIGIGGVVSLLLPTILLNGENMLPAGFEQIGLLLVYALMTQCFAWGLIAYSIPMLSLALTGLLLLTEPVAALLIDYMVLNKPINEVQWFGVVLTLGAIYLGTLRGTER